MIFNMWCVYLPIAFNALLMEFYYCVQLDRLVKEFIVPLEKQISSEQEEKQVVEKEKETQEIVGQKRRACTIDTSSTSSASTETVAAAGGTRRSKRVKVAPTRYVPAEEEESLEECFVIRNIALTAASRPLNVSNEDTNIGSSRRVSAVAAATMVHTRGKVHKTFDERFKDLMAFKAKFGHCNVPCTNSSNNKYRSLGHWCGHVRTSYKVIKEGGTSCKLSKADMKRLENAGFEWNLRTTFDERFKDLMAFKAKFGHCNVPTTQSSNNKYRSLGMWCSHVRTSYKSIKQGGIPLRYKLSKADMKRLENAGFEWSVSHKKITFDERFKDLMAFKAKFGHCNVPQTHSNTNKYLSLGQWCSDIRRSYKAIKEGGTASRNCYKLSKADMKRLENAGFEWNLFKTFDERFKDLMAFKAEFGHCNVPCKRSSNNTHLSLGVWCSEVRRSYKAFIEGRGMGICKISNADVKRLENAGFEWRVKK
jgi:hypothetical protein